MTMQANGHSGSGRHMFEKELLTHLDSLKGFGVSLTGRQDKADDLVQSVIEKALLKWESYELGTNMKAWLFTILKNDFYSQMRKRGREVGWIEGLENSLEHSTIESDGGMTYDFQKHLVYIASLPRDQCDAFVAICYLGMSYEEFAGRANCATGTIKSRVSRARDHLIELIESNTTILEANFDGFKHATRGVPKGHPFYRIAEAYEELFAEARDIKEDSQKERLRARAEPTPASEKEKLWEALVASGALDESHADLDELMQGEFEG